MAKLKQCQSVSKKDCIICEICVKNYQEQGAKTTSVQENINNYDMTPFTTPIDIIDLMSSNIENKMVTAEVHGIVFILWDLSFMV